MTENDIKQGFLTLGLSLPEVEVYLTLVSLGESTSGPLIAKTDLHRNVVYTALEHLIVRKYVIESQKNGKKLFALAEPSIISADFAEKMDLAREISESIKRMAQLPVQEVSVHQGNDEFLSLLMGLMRTPSKMQKTIYIIGTGGESFMENTMRMIWKKYHKVARSEGIQIKMISYESQRLALRDDIVKDRDLYEVRYLPDESENPAGVQIYPWAFTMLNVIYSTSDRPVTAIKIRNDDLVKGQLKVFENLWKVGKN